MLDEKELTTNPHETTRSSNTNFALLVSVGSCDFVVPLLAVKHELTLLRGSQFLL